MLDGVAGRRYRVSVLGRLLTEGFPSCHRFARRLANSVSQSFPRHAAKRLSTVGGTAGTHTYTYRGAGTVWTNLALPNSSRITNAYSSIGALTNTTLRTSGGTVVNRHSYVYNLAQRRTRQTRTDASTVDYTYDNLGQLTRALGSGGQSTENLGYGYDVAWNLNKRTNGAVVQTFTVDVKNQLVTTPYGTCSYDSNGNLSNDGAGRTFTYDNENQLTSVGWGGGNYRTDFVYDGRGRMRKRLDYYYSGGTWTVTGQSWYIYDGMRIIQERDGSNVPTTAYTWGQDLSGSFEGAGGIGGLLARLDQYSAGSWGRRVNSHADGNGNVTALSDSTQAIVGSYVYNPYGQVLAQSGSLAGVNKIRFSTKLWFDSINIYYYGYRFYDPNLQRWVNRDPIGEEGGINLFVFAGNQPVSRFDRAGLSVQPPASPPVTIPVPGSGSSRWVYHPPVQRGKRGFWYPSPPVPGQSQPSLHLDPMGPHWDLDDGRGGPRQHFDLRGNPLTEDAAKRSPHRRPKRGPGALSAAALALSAGAAAGLNAGVDSGLFCEVYAAARAGASLDEIDDLMFDAAVGAAIESGQAGALPGIYGPWWWLK